MKKQTLLHVIFFVGYICVIVGAIIQLLELQFAPYVFSLGAFLVIVFRFLTTNPSSDLRIKRLNKMSTISAILLLISVYLMFSGSNLWVLMLVIVAIFDLVISFRFPT